MKANSIEEVIELLDHIIEDSRMTENRLGYFASLYKMVTERIRDEVAKKPGESMFEDPARMEKLDVIFANRYLDAYSAYTDGRQTTNAWEVAFSGAENHSFIVIQHLFLGMNAHIGMDLGIAAEEVCRDLEQPLEALHEDFDCINAILGSLVGTVEHNLSSVWPPLKFFLRIIPYRFDRVITSFSMELARDKAWKFANQISSAMETEREAIIQLRDIKVAAYGTDLASPPLWLSIFIFLIKLGERRSVSRNIQYLNGVLSKKVNLFFPPPASPQL